MTNTTLIGRIQSIAKDGKSSILGDDSKEPVHFTAPNADLIRKLALCFLGNTKVVAIVSDSQQLVSLAEVKPIEG